VLNCRSWGVGAVGGEECRGVWCVHADVTFHSSCGCLGLELRRVKGLQQQEGEGGTTDCACLHFVTSALCTALHSHHSTLYCAPYCAPYCARYCALYCAPYCALYCAPYCALCRVLYQSLYWALSVHTPFTPLTPPMLPAFPASAWSR
jgi:hypothetical protein